jgi:hypothetical protein
MLLNVSTIYRYLFLICLILSNWFVCLSSQECPSVCGSCYEQT